MTRRVRLYPGEDGFVVDEVPSLPGCISQGETRAEALDNAYAKHFEVTTLAAILFSYSADDYSLGARASRPQLSA